MKRLRLHRPRVDRLLNQGNRRLVLLFLTVVLLPSTVVFFLGTRTMRQARQLELQRTAEERERAATNARQRLKATLDEIKSRALLTRATAGSNLVPADSPVEFVARVAGGRLIPPWQRPPGVNPPYQTTIESANRAEFQAKDYRRATEEFTRAARLARFRTEEAAARLAVARNKLKLGETGSGYAEYRRLAHLPADVTDGAGIPIQFYAVLALTRVDPRAAGELVQTTVYKGCCLSPDAVLMLREILNSVASLMRPAATIGPVELARVDSMLAESRQLEKLRSEYPKVAGQIQASASGWRLFGERPWFVSVGALASRDDSALIAVDARSAIAGYNRAATTYPGEARLALSPGSSNPTGGAVPLSPDLPAVAAQLPDGNPLGYPSSLYGALVVAVIGMMAFSSLLLWVDVRRELRVARLRSDFVASVSHELKTPLTAIRMFAETLLISPSDDERRRHDYLETIINESERLTRLLNNVLDLSKIEQGGKRYRFESLRLADVLQRAADTMQYTLAQHNLQLLVSATDGSATLDLDRDALHQAVLNLLANSMKYSQPGSEIVLNGTVSSSEAIVEVRDTGIGIPTAQRSRVTEKFYRVPNDTNARIPGTGLGLTIVDHIVKGHGGRLEIENNNGTGTVVRMRFPLERPR